MRRNTNYANCTKEMANMINSLEEAGTFLAERSSQPLRAFSTRNFGREEFSEARSVLVPPPKAEAILEDVRSRLGPGLVAFIGTQNSLAKPKANGVEVVVGNGTSQFDILRIAASDAVNYDKGTEDLIKQVQSWDTSFGVDIFQAETDTIQFRLKSMPSDMQAFAQEVYEFCPDIVDQGVGSVEELAEEIRAANTVMLWWD
jgi:hypothetical protein